MQNFSPSRKGHSSSFWTNDTSICIMAIILQKQAKPLDKSLVDDLLNQRRERFRLLKQTNRRELYIVLDSLNGGSNDGFDTAGSDKQNGKIKKQSTAHMLLRILALSFFVPLCEPDRHGLPSRISRDGFEVNDAIAFAESLLMERPRVLEHVFHNESGPAQSSTSHISTTLLPWILPRILCASTMLYYRHAKENIKGTDVHAKALIRLATTVVETSITKVANNNPETRQILEELIRGSILALAGTGIPTFDSKLTPPLRYTPQHKVLPTDPFTIYFDSASSASLPVSNMIQNGMTEGIGGVWMQEDHATYIPPWNAIDQEDRLNLAHLLFINTCDLLVRASSSSPGFLRDLGSLAIELLFSNWSCRIDSNIISHGNLCKAVEDRRNETIRLALQSNYVDFSTVTLERSKTILEEVATDDPLQKKATISQKKLQKWIEQVNTRTKRIDDSAHHLPTLVSEGLRHPKRSTRLLVGRQIVKRVSEMLKEEEVDLRTLDTLFGALHSLFKEASSKVKETAITCLSGLGMVDQPIEIEGLNIRGKILQILVLQLGSDPLIKAMAFSSITQWAARENCTTFQLLAPHLNIIAPDVVERMSKTPNLFWEMVQLMMQNQSKFLQATLQFTLPRIVELEDDKTLNLIAKGVGLDVPTMCFNNAPEILKSLLMILPVPKRDRIMQSFIAKVQVDNGSMRREEEGDDGNNGISLKSLLKGYSVDLLGHLVSNLGDPSSLQRKKATEGLQYMCSSLNNRQRGNMTTQSRGLALSQYLKDEILAILSWLNEDLVNGHGKKSMAHKAKVTRSIGSLIGIIGESISSVTPQLMATLNTTMQVRELMLPTLESWNTFVTRVRHDHVGPFIGQTAAALLASWPKFGRAEKHMANNILTYVVVDNYSNFEIYLNGGDFPDLFAIRSDIREVWNKLSNLANKRAPKRAEQRLAAILGRVSNENASMCSQALLELRSFLLTEQVFLDEATTGNVFDPVIGKLIRVLFDAMARDDDNIRDLSFENLGIVGAVDPDRLLLPDEGHVNAPLSDLKDREELTIFATSLISDVLVGAYKATHDTKHQSALAYAIQELLKFCGFTVALLPSASSLNGAGNSRREGGGGSGITLKTRQRWNASLAVHMETLAPLLESKYLVHHTESLSKSRPFYNSTASFKEWIQTWTNALIIELPGDHVSTVFDVFRSVIRDHDLTIAQHILPHLVLNAVTSEDDASIHEEIIAVLQDQVSKNPKSHSERAAQVIFGILDHLSVWQRARQREKVKGNSESVDANGAKVKKSNRRDAVETSIGRVGNLMKAISCDLMAKASLRCRAYARSLLNHEEQIRTLSNASKEKFANEEIQSRLEDLHLIYANLDEPDGMEGVSCYVLQPSLDHQIREHESTGRWTAAQSCWEVKIQQSPKELDLHIGLLRCLRSLGHYDTMRTHIRGVIASVGAQSDLWQEQLAAFYVEGCCILSDWDEVRRSTSVSTQTPQLAMARVMLAMHDYDTLAFQQSIKGARHLLGRPLIGRNKSMTDYLSAYDTVSQLHMLHEFNMIGQALGLIEVANPNLSLPSSTTTFSVKALGEALKIRLESTLPSFRTREPILSLRRSALSTRSDPELKSLAGQCWIASSKIARREGHLQTSYSAALQASQWKVPLAFVQRAKLLAINDQSQAALREMTTSLKNISDGDHHKDHSLANANLFRARLAESSGRSHPNEILEMYKLCTSLDSKSEKMWYHLGRYYDQLQEKDSTDQSGSRIGNPLVQHYNTCKYFLSAANHGTKYFYRTVPRVLTIWLTVGDDENLLNALRKAASTSSSTNGSKSKSKSLDAASIEHINQFKKINDMVRRAIRIIAPYQWLAVFPQLVSRVAHRNDYVWKTLQELIAYTVEVYPDQAMWIMVAGLQSTDKSRRDRFLEIVNRVKATAKSNEGKRHIAKIIDQMIKIAKELLYLCDCPIDADVKKLDMASKFPTLLALGRKGDIILPMQSSLSVTMPPTFSADQDYKVFDENTLPRIIDFDNTVEVMHSLQRPRKIIIKASDGQSYAFLCKPKDDLRKDARLMEFDSMINNLLQSNPDSRKRKLYIRTYAVVTLNEECGLIEWVPNTVGLRHILHRLYAARNIHLYTQQVKVDMEAARKDPKKAGEIFTTKVLARYPPVFHEWFLTMFPEPSSWLAARLNYGHTLAVMSMVGHVLGLGDRHGENILFDSMSGDTVHVDLNCLFDKGSTFEIPERVPFRLTQNLVDALGITGVEGVFRKAAEITMNVLREHKDSLMSVLEAMVHDPLVEWDLEGAGKGKNANNRADPRVAEARKALDPISRKLLGQLRKHGHHGSWTSIHSTNALVDALIRDATSPTLLAQMYIGWASYL